MPGFAPSTFNFSKVKSYTYENLEGLSDYFDQCERQFPTENFDDKVRILVLASPKKFQSLAEDAVEGYCDEWGGDKHKEFREYYGGDEDIFDVNQGERVFLTPFKKRATRLLDKNDEPSYKVARGRILGAVLGSEGVDELANPVRGAVKPLLFPEVEKLDTNSTDPVVTAFVYGLNAVQTPMEYLSMVAEWGNIPLQESSALLADLNSLAILHSSLRGALVNISNAGQLEKVLQVVFPRKFRADKVDSQQQPVPSAPVARVNEILNAVQSELLNLKNDIFDHLKEAQKTNARENDTVFWSGLTLLNILIGAIVAIEEGGRGLGQRIMTI